MIGRKTPRPLHRLAERKIREWLHAKNMAALKEARTEALSREVWVAWTEFGEVIFGEYWDWKPKEELALEQKRQKKPELESDTAYILAEINKLPGDARKEMQKIIRSSSMAMLGWIDEVRVLTAEMEIDRKEIAILESQGVPKSDALLQKELKSYNNFYQKKKEAEEVIKLIKNGLKAVTWDLMTKTKKAARHDEAKVRELEALQDIFGKAEIDDRAATILHSCCLAYAKKIYSPEFMQMLRIKHISPWFLLDGLTLGIHLWPRGIYSFVRKSFRKKKS